MVRCASRCFKPHPCMRCFLETVNLTGRKGISFTRLDTLGMLTCRATTLRLCHALSWPTKPCFSTEEANAIKSELNT